MKILTARQEAKSNMHEVVIANLDANSTITATNPALTAAITEFKTAVANINSAALASSVVTTGITADKKVSKKELSETASVIAGQIFAYAAKNKNNEMKQAVNFSSSDLKRMKDGELVPRCQTIHDLGNANKVILADYGINTATLSALQTAIDAYAQTVPKPRTAITDRSTVKANLKQYFNEADTILTEQIDRLIEPFAKEHPDFVNTYKSARIIIDPQPKKKKPDGTNNGETTTPA